MGAERLERRHVLVLGYRLRRNLGNPNDPDPPEESPPFLFPKNSQPTSKLEIKCIEKLKTNKLHIKYRVLV